MNNEGFEAVGLKQEQVSESRRKYGSNEQTNKRETSVLNYIRKAFIYAHKSEIPLDEVVVGDIIHLSAGEATETSFTKGVNAVLWVLIQFMIIMVLLVFIVNGLTKGSWLSAFLFGISIAVVLTPEMLPMIVTTCLAKGAVSMSKNETIVKNLNSIQNFGAIDILCTDKTGTLTKDSRGFKRKRLQSFGCCPSCL